MTRLAPELIRLADAQDWRGLAALLAPCQQPLPDPARLYRGLGLDDAALDTLLSNLAAGRGVPALEPYAPERLAYYAATESLARGFTWASALFKNRTPEVEAALHRLKSALFEVKSLFMAEVVQRLPAEPEIEGQLLEKVAKHYVLGEIPPFLQSAAVGGADGVGAGWALLFAVEKGLRNGKQPVVVEFDRPASGVIEAVVYPDGVHELVVLGDIPDKAVRALWMEGRRFEREEFGELLERRRSQISGTGGRVPSMTQTSDSSGAPA